MPSAHDTIVVTGGSTGIGSAICRQLLDEGHQVINLARRPAEFSDARLHNIELDLSDRAATADVAGQPSSRTPSCTISNST